MTSDDKNPEECLKNFIDTHFENRNQLSVMEETYNTLSNICTKLNAGESKHLKFLIKRLHCTYLLYTLSEINKGIIQSLKEDLFTVVECLSRVSIEHSVNLMYILDDEGNERSKSLLKHYLTDSKKKAEKWLFFSEKIDDKESLQCAKDKIHHLNNILKHNPNLVDKDVKGWKNARQRFAELELEHHYHTLFASSSDSIHSLSEDMFNLFWIENLPEIIRKRAFLEVQAEKLSFAYYLAANSLLFFAGTLLRVSILINEDEIKEATEVIVEKLKKMVIAHNKLTSDFYKVS
jgi:hypothetical protein